MNRLTQHVKSEQEKNRILKQLSDMFTNIQPNQLRVVCEQSYWDVDNCVDFLFSQEGQLEFQKNVNNIPPVSSTLPLQCPPTMQNVGGAIPKALNAEDGMHKSAFMPYRNQQEKEFERQKLLFEKDKVKSEEFACTDAITLKNRAEHRIFGNIECGHKVMVIMRGVPGSGKSHLAKSILNRCPEPYEQYSSTDFILSTDNYFIVRGSYRFVPEKLHEYHRRNQKQAQECCQYGFSPLIIDNTNVSIADMQPYAMMALRYGYVLEILMPDTSWRNSPGKLAMKNSHGISKEKIERILNNFETCYTSIELLKKLNASYEVPLPQYRDYPPLASMQLSYLGSNLQLINNLPDQERGEQQSIVNRYIKKENYEVEKEKRKQKYPMPLLDLLKADDVSNKEATKEDITITSDKLERHSIDCSRENKAFATLRQIYPNHDISGLWDLFVNCDGDADWCADLMLKENDLCAPIEQDHTNTDKYYCKCDLVPNTEKNIKSNQTNKKVNDVQQIAVINSNNNNTNKSRNMWSKNVYLEGNSKRKIRETVENLFQCDGNDSEHARRARSIRKSKGRADLKPTHEEVQSGIRGNDSTDDDHGDDTDCEERQMLKISLGGYLIGQLSDEFSADLPLSEYLPKNLSANIDVFVPRSMAKELYLMYAESVYNLMEEQRSQTIREDEDFARLLTLPQFEDCETSPPNMTELLAAMNSTELQQEHHSKINAELKSNCPDLATQLTLDRLVDEFPNIPRETLEEIFSANKQNYFNTVDLLNKVDLNQSSSPLYLLRSEGSGRSMSVQNDNRERTDNRSSTPSSSSTKSSFTNIDNNIKPTPKFTLDEQKRHSVMDFEKSRNMAAHHSRLKFECYRKAKEAIARNNHGVALYYSEVARMHLSKIDHYNQQSANCIMEAHKLTTSNPELLDMHYLHLDEALACLEIFLDRHISTLHINKRPYKYVFIITGRGRHSATGTSVIKTHVKARVKERALRWTEINPGLIKIKLFPTDNLPS